MSEGFSALPGKCLWWRERTVEEDAYNIRVKDADKRVACSCFVEGDGWEFPRAAVPDDCPHFRHCRYYIRNY